jgi:hypothetical protein
MRTLRWLLLVPATLGALCLLLMVGVAAHYLVEQHLCPAADFDRGICSSRAMGVALAFIKHGFVTLAVIGAEGMAVVVAPARKAAVLWAASAGLVLLAAYLGYAGNAGSLFVAALVGAVMGAAAMMRFLRRPTASSGPG